MVYGSLSLNSSLGNLEVNLLRLKMTALEMLIS